MHAKGLEKNRSEQNIEIKERKKDTKRRWNKTGINYRVTQLQNQRTLTDNADPAQ
jgi:ribosome assembly protein YihI (activator of Der GTPase)